MTIILFYILFLPLPPQNNASWMYLLTAIIIFSSHVICLTNLMLSVSGFYLQSIAPKIKPCDFSMCTVMNAYLCVYSFISLSSANNQLSFCHMTLFPFLVKHRSAVLRCGSLECATKMIL